MGVCTKRAKRVVAAPTITYPGSRRYQAGRRVAVRADDSIAVVFKPGAPAEIITVLWHTAKAREEGPRQ
jgi:hypothetical protein